MYGHDQIRDSYQNLVCSPDGNESVESIGPAPDRGSVERATDDAEPPEDDGAGQGRAASGEPYEDEADNALLHPKRKAGTGDTYDGGDLSPTGKVIERAEGPDRQAK